MSFLYSKQRVAWALVGLAMLAAGCAYEIRGSGRVLYPDRLEAVRKITVAPYVYTHDWTGQFRDIYRKAGVPALKGEKRERIEGTFLLENHTAARNYALIPWPGVEKAVPAPLSERIAWVRKKLARLRVAGAQGVLVAAGESSCRTVEYCHARLEVVLLDTEKGRVLWKWASEGSTLFAQGDEMAALVRNALESIPEAGGPVGGIFR